MGRPRTIAPDGEIAHLSFRLSADLADELRREADATGRTMGAVIRDRLTQSVRRQPISDAVFAYRAEIQRQEAMIRDLRG